MWCRETSETS